MSRPTRASLHRSPFQHPGSTTTTVPFTVSVTMCSSRSNSAGSPSISLRRSVQRLTAAAPLRGNAAGLVEEWIPAPADEQGGGYARSAVRCDGSVPWFSLHDKEHYDKGGGAFANRGLIVRRWQARLGGRDVPAPYAATFRTPDVGRFNLELVPPPEVKELLPGDFVAADVEMIILPIAADDYYGPNRNLRSALVHDADTWKMVHREVVGNDLRVEARARFRASTISDPGAG